MLLAASLFYILWDKGLLSFLKFGTGTGSGEFYGRTAPVNNYSVRDFPPPQAQRQYAPAQQYVQQPPPQYNRQPGLLEQLGLGEGDGSFASAAPATQLPSLKPAMKKVGFFERA